MSNRKIIKRAQKLRITDRAIDLFDSMEALEQACACGGDIHHECNACEQYWRHHWALHDELKLRPWQPAYGNYEDTNKTGVLNRYRALKAASDTRKRAA